MRLPHRALAFGIVWAMVGDDVARNAWQKDAVKARGVRLSKAPSSRTSQVARNHLNTPAEAQTDRRARSATTVAPVALM